MHYRIRNKHWLTAIIKDKKGNILSIGKNSYVKTHPLMYKLAKGIGDIDTKKIYIHAEIDAIVRCKDLTRAYTIEIYRIKYGEYFDSKPCPICMSGIINSGIKYLIYTEKGALIRIKLN